MAPSNRTSDPVLYDFPMPLSARYHPLGFPLEIATNSESVLAAAEESWAVFPERFATPPIRLRLGVIDNAGKALPSPSVRAQGNLISFIGDAENYSIGDMDTGFGFGWLSSAVVRNQAFVRFYYLESLVLTLINAAHVHTIHAACVVLNGHGVLLCGPSGAGKSTLAYACAKRGWGYVSDDASCLLKGRADRLVIGNPHRLRLRQDAGEFFPEFRDRPVTQRFNGKMSKEIVTASEPQIKRVPECQIHQVVFLHREPGAKASIIPFSREHALAELAAVISYGSPEDRQTRVSNFRNLLEVPVVRMKYSTLEDAVNCLANVTRSPH